jgi:4a-hydroxytetrahydrobiopterin dehydratase
MARPTALSPDEIRNSLATLDGWETVERTPGGADHVHVELHRVLRFGSFADAMHFMLTASRHIHITDHHPSWQNTYSTVEIWITTGELKHQLSAKDFALARYLSELFPQYESK